MIGKIIGLRRVCSYKKRPKASLRWSSVTPIHSRFHSSASEACWKRYDWLHPEALRIPYVYESTRNNIRTGYDGTVLLAQGNDNDQNSVLGQKLAIAQYDVSYVTNAKSVNQNIASGNFAGFAGRAALNFHNFTDIGNKDVIGINTNGLC